MKKLAYVMFCILGFICMACPKNKVVEVYTNISTNIHICGIVQASDGNYIVAGSYNVEDIPEILVTEDLYLFKIDGNGNVLWQKRFESNIYDYAKSVITTSDNYISVCGKYGSQPWLLKLDNDGGVIWENKYSDEVCANINHIQTLDNGYAINNIDYGTGSFFIKTDYNGNLDYSISINYGFSTSCYDMEQTAMGDYLFTGSMRQTSANHYDVFLLSIDQLKNTNWLKIYTNTEDTKGYTVHILSNNSYLITGEADDNCYVLTINSNGDLVSEWTYSSGTCEHSIIAGNGDYILCGNDYVKSINNSGSVNWHATLPYPGANGIVETTDGGFLVTYYNTARIIKLDSSGAVVWEKSY